MHEFHRADEHVLSQAERYRIELDQVIVDPDVVGADPAAQLLVQQARNHLQHVAYDFRVAADSDDYPYEVTRTEAYENAHTQAAVTTALRTLELVRNDQYERFLEITLPDGYVKEAQAEQDNIVQRLLSEPFKVYEDFAQRRSRDGAHALFPELGWTIKGLFGELAAKSEVRAACEQSPILTALRNELITDMQLNIENGVFCYEPSLRLIERTMGFFDVVSRVNNPDPEVSPPPYHSARFEYNWHSLLNDENMTLLPTMGSMTSADLLKIRGVPVGIVGVSTDTITVDGFPQTPYEFFMHDVDHTRRMHDETMLAVEREGISLEKYSKEATELIHEVLLPAVDITGLTDGDEKDRRIAMRMILFEILHEDGLDPVRDTIAEAILRAPMERTPFERVVNDGQTIEYFMSPRASMLAHVYRKLAHTFYDFPERRSSSLGSDNVRRRAFIAQGAADLYRLVSDDPIEDEDLLAATKALVSTDEGFTDAFIGNLAHDIRRRGAGKSALQLMVTKPKGVAGAVREARKFAEGRHIHSLFGYSGLEYEQPDELQRQVIEDLQAFNPGETAIAIGATPYGIGRLYPVVKEMGFLTMGIVASKAVGQDEECAEGVDGVVVVKDNEWGGYRYSESTHGLLSPTTRVFIGASDSIAAYGGGTITAVTLPAAIRKGKTVTFTPFEMNHEIARMIFEQRGEHVSDYRGPAYATWLALHSI